MIKLTLLSTDPLTAGKGGPNARETDLWVNGRFLLADQPTGTHRSAANFCLGLAHHWPGRFHLGTDPRASRAGPFLQASPNAILHPSRLTTGWRAHLWEQFLFPRLAPRAVQLHCMGTAPFLFPARRQTMFIHDLNFMILRDTFSHTFRLWYRLACALAARRSRHLICFTGYVKSSITRLLGIPAQRISVIPQGPGIEEDLLAQTHTPGFADPFFMCVGSLQPHKNLRAVLQAWFLWKDRPASLGLKIIGQPQRNFMALQIPPHFLDQPGVSFTGYVSDAELVRHYHHALAFVYPSLEEGFGLPVVEAFHAGCPVITSHASCLPEVAGEAALLVDPHQPEELTRAMQRIYSEPRLRQRLIAAGRLRAQLFSWDSASRALVNLLLEISSGKIR